MNPRDARSEFFRQAVAGATIENCESFEDMLPAGALIGDLASDGYRIRWDSRRDHSRKLLVLSNEAAQAADLLVQSLLGLQDLRRRATRHQVLVRVLEAVGATAAGAIGGARGAARLVEDLRGHFRGSVVVLPIGGVQWRGAPALLSPRVAIGRLSEELEELVSQLGQAIGITEAFHFAEDTMNDWTEDLVSLREDPDAFDDGRSPHFPVAVAVAVEGRGRAADHAALHVCDGILGAAWAAEYDREGPPQYPPWIHGTQHLSLSDLEAGDIALGITLIRHVGQRAESESLEFGGGAIPVEAHLEGKWGPVVRACGHAALDDPVARRISGASRQAHLAASSFDALGDLAAFSTALEALVVTSKKDVTAQFCARVSALAMGPGAARDALRGKLKQAYDLRSDAVHGGTTTRAFVDIADGATLLQKLFLRVTPDLATRWEAGELRDDDELAGFLESLP